MNVPLISQQQNNFRQNCCHNFYLDKFALAKNLTVQAVSIAYHMVDWYAVAYIAECTGVLCMVPVDCR